MKIETFKLHYPNPLVHKYLYDFDQVKELFTANPYDYDAFVKRQKTVAEEYRTDRGELVRILLSYNRQLGCDLNAEQNIEKLGLSESLVIITGQQAGVFTGPLYTIYKTISVLQLAQKMSKELQVPVIPMFWVAAEDHDFAEINHLDLLNRDSRLERLVLDQEPTGKYSVGNIPVTGKVFELIDALDESTNPAEWKADYIIKLRDNAKRADNLADWFAMVMTDLFTGTGLVMVNPLLHDFRKLMGPLFKQFVTDNDAVNRSFNMGRERVKSMGFTPQVEKEPESLHLFRYIDGERLPMYKSGTGTYTVRGQQLSWHEEQVLMDISQAPWDFSPNVVLRPVAQDYALPLLAYVAGPGEISYYALYKEIYPVFGMSMPIIYPRANVTLVEGGIAKLMQKYALSIEDVFDLASKQKKWLKQLETVDIEGLFEGLKNKFTAELDQTAAHVHRIDHGLDKVGLEVQNKIMYQLHHYLGKVQQSHRKQHEVVIRQFEKIGNALYPKGIYQERLFNIFPYLFKHGPELLKALTELPLLDDVEHKLVFTS